MSSYNFFVYIITNFTKSTLYTGMTNDLEQRLVEHYLSRGNPKSFAGKYHCYNLLFFERFQYVDQAIEYEKEIKLLNRAKKESLINEFNPNWKFLNNEIMEWPPEKDVTSR